MRLALPAALAALALLAPVGTAAQSLTRTIPGPLATVQTAGSTGAAPNVFTVAAPNGLQTRANCQLWNAGSAPIFVYLKPPNGAAASIAAAVPVAPGASFTCQDGEQDEIDVASTQASQPFVLMLR